MRVNKIKMRNIHSLSVSVFLCLCFCSSSSSHHLHMSFKNTHGEKDNSALTLSVFLSASLCLLSFSSSLSSIHHVDITTHHHPSSMFQLHTSFPKTPHLTPPKKKKKSSLSLSPYTTLSPFSQPLK